MIESQKINPNKAAQNTLGAARQQADELHRQGRHREAAAVYQKYLLLNPADAGAWLNLGVSLRTMKQFVASAAHYHRSLAIRPDDGGAYSNLGNVLRDMDRIEEAIAAHEKAVSLDPENSSYRYNYAMSLRDARRFKEALKQLEICLESCTGPKYSRQWAKLEFDRSLVLLYLGQFKKGWEAYESRWYTGDLPDRLECFPCWTGEALTNRKLLLFAEQGFGDSILAARFLPWLREKKARNGHITLVCRQPLHRLFDALPVDEMMTIETLNQQLQKGEADYDYQGSMMSLPGLYGASLRKLPPPAHLTIPAQAREKFSWLKRSFQGKLKVGVVWSGSITFAANSKRAVSLERFIDLAMIPGVQLFSLQKGPKEHDLASHCALPLIVDLGSQVNDFAETAAAIDALDVVVMTDSSVAHLTASLNKPVINLLNYKPYWLYFPEGERTPWYPSMRCIWQTTSGEWDDVFKRVKVILGSWLENAD